MFTVSFAKLDRVTFNQQGNNIITITSNSSDAIVSSENNTLAYRPNYQDLFGSNLATIFIHMQAVYSCVASYQDISCKLLPNEDDGFRGGRAIFEAMDNGKDFSVFSGITYAFALEGCSQLNSTCYAPGYRYEFILMCLISSSACYN